MKQTVYAWSRVSTVISCAAVHLAVVIASTDWLDVDVAFAFFPVFPFLLFFPRFPFSECKESSDGCWRRLESPDKRNEKKQKKTLR